MGLSVGVDTCPARNRVSRVSSVCSPMAALRRRFSCVLAVCDIQRWVATTGRLIVSITGVFVIAGCSVDDPVTAHELSGAAMGTSYSLTIVDPLTEDERHQLADEVSAVLERIEQSMSTWRPDSELSRFNRQASTDWIPVSDELYSVVETAQEISRLTAGAFDITVGPLVNLWGFGPDSASDHPPEQTDVARVRSLTEYRQLDLRESPPALRKHQPELYIDLSAIAKGYAVDRLAELLDSRSINHYLVEVGGELRARGQNARLRSWTIAVEKPMARQRSVQRLLRIGDQAVATSGDYRNFFEADGTRYSHTIDPRTGAPVTHSLALVTVVADTAIVADAMATGFSVMGTAEGFDLANHLELAALFIERTADGYSERMTPAFTRLIDEAP